MKNKPYKRKPGELEIRILNNGRVVMIMPDERLLEIAQTVQLRPNVAECKEATKKCRNKRHRN
jgi:hypothetical protein